MFVQNCVRELDLCKLLSQQLRLSGQTSVSAPLFRHSKLLTRRTDATLLPTVPPTRLETLQSQVIEAQFAEYFPRSSTSSISTFSTGSFPPSWQISLSLKTQTARQLTLTWEKAGPLFPVDASGNKPFYVYSAVLRGSDLDGWASSHCLSNKFINCKPICRKSLSAFLVSLSEVCLVLFWKASGLLLAISCIYTSSPKCQKNSQLPTNLLSEILSRSSISNFDLWMAQT